MDKISIILPVYNCESFIVECLESIKNQTIDNFEVVLIDDCSTDNTSEILKRYSSDDSRFLYNRNETNLKISASRNKGISLASGDYLFFIDSDDVIDISCLEKLYKALKNNEADVSICGFEMFTDTYKKDADFKDQIILNNDELMKEIARCESIQNFAWGKLFKKELFNGVVFPEGRVYEDVYVIPYVLSKTNKAVFLEEKLYFYRQNPTSISKTLSLSKIQDFFLSMEQKGKLILEQYTKSAYLMSQSFFDLFYLLKEYKVQKEMIPNYKTTKMLYKRIVSKASLKQKIKYLIAVM